ncbi:energy transducer TonB [Rapidithrix thailandica]|uniref:Energy transducer TonB n=1 Tax=Rapidithrix thailandica TaxID=413964 RepID=A0AAW9S5M9_9BACT
MVQVLQTLGIGGITVLFIGATIGITLLFRFITDKNGKDILRTKEHVETSVLSKKYKEVDTYRYRGIIRNLSLALSLAVILAVFEFPTLDKGDLVDLGTIETEYEEIQEIPPTIHKPPPPPKIQQPNIVAVADEEEIEQEIEIDLDIEIDEETVIEEVTVSNAPEVTMEEEPEAEEIFHVVEEPAAPIGGYRVFYEFVRDHMKYPPEARRLNVQGKVFVQFIVDTDGKLTEAKPIRGIGAGCDKEAVRVISKAPKWKPGKQRGRTVKQYMVIPISFVLE